MSAPTFSIESEAVYPKAHAPLTWAVLASANARADRWKERCDSARAERDRLQAILDGEAS